MKILGKYPSLRMRRNRKSDWVRRLVSENNLTVNDLILPIFIREGKNKVESIKTMPGIYRRSVDKVNYIVDEASKLNIPLLAIFPQTPNIKKKPLGTEALIENNTIDLEKIKRYVCCSGSSVIILLLICNYSLDIIHKLSDKLKYDELLDLNDLDILFDNLGVFSNEKIGKLVDCILHKKFKKKNITLKEFYDLTKKEFICSAIMLISSLETY